MSNHLHFPIHVIPNIICSINLLLFIDFRQGKMGNPWQVDSIWDFSHLHCPECNFNSKEEHVFKNHAVGTHPLSFVLFENEFHKEVYQNVKEEPIDESDEFLCNVDPYDNEYSLDNYDKESFDSKEDMEIGNFGNKVNPPIIMSSTLHVKKRYFLLITLLNFYKAM